MTEYIISRTDLSAIQRTKIDLYGGIELVRCKECWCWNEEEQHGCTHDMGANDFCSKAERKEECKQ